MTYDERRHDLICSILTGILAGGHEYIPRVCDRESIAHVAVEIADKVLKRLEKENESSNG